MRPILPRATVAAGFLLTAAFAIACAPPSGPDLARRFPEGLRLGYAVEAPYAFVDETGRVTGAVPELARRVAQRLDLPVTFVQTDFGALLDQLEEGRFDVMSSGMFITAERAKRVRFSVPTFRAVDAALVRRGNPKALHSLADVRQHGASVVVLAASVEEAAARRAGIAADRTIVLPDSSAARRALESGRADLLLNTEPTVRWIAARDSARAFDVAEPFEADPAADAPPHLGAFAFRLGDGALAEAWNRELAGLLGTPEHLALVEPFGFSRRSLPSAADATQARKSP